MKTFKIEVQELLARVVEVEAESTIDAVSIINEQYRKTEIVLDYNDFVQVNFLDIDSENDNSERDKLTNEIIDYLFEDEKKHFEELDGKSDDHIFLKLRKLKEIL